MAAGVTGRLCEIGILVGVLEASELKREVIYEAAGVPWCSGGGIGMSHASFRAVYEDAHWHSVARGKRRGGASISNTADRRAPPLRLRRRSEYRLDPHICGRTGGTVRIECGCSSRQA